METKEYFEKVMQDYNQHRDGRSLRKYCKDEAIDYEWLMKFKKSYPISTAPQDVMKPKPEPSFIPLEVTGQQSQLASSSWQVEGLILKSPEGDSIEIKSNNLLAVSELLRKMM